MNVPNNYVFLWVLLHRITQEELSIYETYFLGQKGNLNSLKMNTTFQDITMATMFHSMIIL